MAAIAKTDQKFVMLARCRHQDTLGQFEFEKPWRQPEIGQDRRDRIPQLKRHFEINARKVYGNRWYGNTGIEPLSDLAAGLTHDPTLQRNDQTAPFGLCDEMPGTHHTASGMLPAYQGFETENPTGVDSDLRLVDQKELVREDAFAEFRVQAESCPDLDVHGICKKPKSSAALLFCPIKRHIRM